MNVSDKKNLDVLKTHMYIKREHILHADFFFWRIPILRLKDEVIYLFGVTFSFRGDCDKTQRKSRQRYVW